MQRTGKQENRIKELDALRGIAAIFVVLFHFTLHRPEAPSGFSLGVTGVDLFFIISGFVILMTLEKTGHWKDFVVSRFSRLYPGYWTCVTITAIAIAAHSIYHHKDLGNFGVLYLGNMTMLQKYLRIADMDGPYWTMIVEMLFYMLMLSIFLLRKLDMIEPIFALALPAIGLYSLDIFHVRFPQLSWILGGGFPLINHFPLFFSGILFYKIKVNGLSTTRLALLAACLGLQLMLFNDGGRSREFVSLAQYAAMLVGYYILFALFIKGKLTFLVNRITLFLGGISYALYLVHQFLGMHILIPSFESLNMGFAAAAIASLAVVITIAWLVTYCVEKPAMKYIKTIYKNRKAVQTAGTNPAEAMETPGLQVQPVNNEHN